MEIKFRQPIVDKKGKFIEWFYWGRVDGNWIEAAIHQNGRDTRDLSQRFTGLMRDDVEIYQGDIFDDAGHRLIIDYGQYEYAADSECYLETCIGFFVLRVTPHGRMIQNMEAIANYTFPIIGNLYEHPNLKILIYDV